MTMPLQRMVMLALRIGYLYNEGKTVWGGNQNGYEEDKKRDQFS